MGGVVLQRILNGARLAAMAGLSLGCCAARPGMARLKQRGRADRNRPMDFVDMDAFVPFQRALSAMDIETDGYVSAEHNG